MGVFKKFIGGLAVESVQAETEFGYNKTGGLPYKDLNGTTRQIKAHASGPSPVSTHISLSPYAMLYPEATSDELTNYDLFDYQIERACSTTLTSRSRTQAATYALATLIIHIENDKSEAVTVKCIKFRKDLSYNGSGDTSPVLVCGYYLDNPITLNPGDTTDISLSLKFGVDVSVNET